jgi:hypothetical protein
MPKLPECDCCLLYSHNPHIFCTVHPNGSVADSCLDFREDPNAEPVELWEPEEATYYNGELIVQPQQRWTQQQKLELLDWRCLLVDVHSVVVNLTGATIQGCIGIVNAAGWMIQFRAFALSYFLALNAC